MYKSTPHILEVRPKIPARLARLEELANNLWYSWDLPTRDLFSYIQRKLWDEVGQNPKAFLRCVDERCLITASEDQIFLDQYHRTLSAYDSYHTKPVRNSHVEGFAENDLIAYFCAEFGFHESFPIYSGGLGILAGDHCKSASDMHLPFVGVGLLYRQGYFQQTIDGDGNQKAIYTDSEFESLPISPVLNSDGSGVHVSVDLPGRRVAIKVWKARVGNVTIYLLDTDLMKIPSKTVPLPTIFMAATNLFVSNRKSCSELVVPARSRQWASSRVHGTSMKAMPPFCCWNASAS